MAKLMPIKRENGFPKYPPKLLAFWQREKRRRTGLNKADAFEYGDYDLPMTGMEWLRARERAEMLLKKVGDNLKTSRPTSVHDITNLIEVYQVMSDDMKKTAAKIMMDATIAAVENPDTPVSEKAVMIGQFRGLMKEATEMLRGKMGEPQQPGTVNLTQINLAGELEKNPGLVKLLLKTAKKQGLLENVNGEIDAEPGLPVARDAGGSAAAVC